MPSSPSSAPLHAPESSHLAANPAKGSVRPVSQPSLSFPRPQTLPHPISSAVLGAGHARPGAQTAAGISPEMLKNGGRAQPRSGQAANTAGAFRCHVVSTIGMGCICYQLGVPFVALTPDLC